MLQQHPVPAVFLDTLRAAQRVHVTRATVRNWVKSGALRAYRPGRKILVREDDLLALVERSAA